MKQLCARLLVIAVMGSLLATAGCVLSNGDLVLTDNVCVNIDEVQTDGSFSVFVVADGFKEQLEKKLKENGQNPKDVKSIHMVSASFKSVKVSPHDWTVDADIDIARQDTEGGAYDDGPAPLVSFEDQSLKALKGAPNVPALHADGVALVDRALASLLAGEDPRLVLIVNNESVDPTPSESDPMAFTTTACVKFQFVVAKNGGGNRK
jgi:hypothetical protein